jgi:hypothetical protein
MMSLSGLNDRRDRRILVAIWDWKSQIETITDGTNTIMDIEIMTESLVQENGLMDLQDCKVDVVSNHGSSHLLTTITAVVLENLVALSFRNLVIGNMIP